MNFARTTRVQGRGLWSSRRSAKEALPEGKPIYFRSGSVAYQSAVVNHYSQSGRSFSITTDLDVAVKGEITHLPETT